MNETQRKTLLRIAKETMESVIDDRTVTKPKSDDPELNTHSGCFVTLKNQGRLRGCIGQFTSEQPLIELVGEMARASTSGDARFFDDPITPEELCKLDIEISVLSPLQRTDNPLSLRLGVDGIYIRRGYASGCFLPQVATEAGWSKEEFLSYCCSHKAGLSPDAWKRPGIEVYLFTAEVFGAQFEQI